MDSALVLVDDVFTFTEETQGYISLFEGARPPHIPASLESPVDYRGGHIDLFLDVREKSTAEPVNVLLRLLVRRHARETCTVIGYRRAIVRTPGEYHFAERITETRPMTDPTEFSWNLPLYQAQLVLADTAGQMIHTQYETDIGLFHGHPDLARYVPLRMRFRAILHPDG